jgi:Asp-tRNA(Asn)/Glu-tRNA(Gln) amidotransferase A subunit family amidase
MFYSNSQPGWAKCSIGWRRATLPAVASCRSQLSTAGTTHGKGLVVWVVRYWRDELGRDPQPGELEPRTDAFWRAGQQVSAGDMLMAHTRLQEYSRQIAAAYDNPGDGFDLWLTYVTPQRIGAARQRRRPHQPSVFPFQVPASRSITGASAWVYPPWTVM